MDKSAYQIRLQQWAQLIHEANNSGMAKKDWCAQNGITVRVFYYWHKKVRDYVMEQTPAMTGESTSLTAGKAVPADPVFCEIPVPAGTQTSSECPPGIVAQGFSPEAMVQVGRYGIFVGRSISGETLTTILRAISNA